MRGLKRVALFVLLVVACARMAPPPGGPRRLLPPKLVGTFPDSGVAPCDFRGAAEFRFDEVTDEGTTPNFGIGTAGIGTGTLEQLIMLSPDTVIPRVEWHRDRITVRPRNGWRPNQTYRIELAAGLRDLHGNISKGSHTIAFTTCGPRPTRVLSGRVADWVSARAVPGALIEAYHLPDSARYRTIADSTGRFRMTELPAGPYLVVATVHTDRTRRRDPFKESWDSVRVDAARDTVGEIWTFPRDTLPPKIVDATRQDSQSILVTFAKPLDPALRIDSSAVHVRLFIDGDTVSIGTMYAMPKVAYDLHAEGAHRPDSEGRFDRPGGLRAPGLDYPCQSAARGPECPPGPADRFTEEEATAGRHEHGDSHRRVPCNWAAAVRDQHFGRTPA